MNLRTALLAPLTLLALSLPAVAEKLPLKTVSTYLNSIKTVEAPFTQVNADGSESYGTLFIHRPNRMRFEYATPDKTVVLASGGQVAIFDGKSNQPPEQYPLKRTPLNLILARNVDLGRARMVVGHDQAGDMTVVRAQDPENPEYGYIDLFFDADPVELREWVVTDEYGTKTHVMLGQITAGSTYPASKFTIESEIARRK
ncbi:MAG: LolA family protein [Paracoccaceae bacterium]